MSKSRRFEDLFTWQEAVDLAKVIFALSSGIKDFAIKDQIERAVLSVSTNIAEGNELGTDRQFVKFLLIAKGSCGEVRSLLLVTRELNIMDENSIMILVKKCTKLSIMIYKLILVRTKGFR